MARLKDNLKNINKGSKSVTDYMQTIKTKANELATLGKPLDHKEKVLEGLDDSYQSIIDAVNSRDTLITFDELHEKLIHKELSLHTISPSLPLPASAYLANTRSNPRTPPFCPSGSTLNRSYQSVPNPPNQPTSQTRRPFLGKFLKSTHVFILKILKRPSYVLA
ncbi:hypothetical protein J1N35_044071 [Gossypium stocksii]|uniref:Uncharacterized protein n=1 Tax=Gossypium stocksii TaxID=47602 RepID=A0A9D3ZFS8_9ROSI|nr:hypothetical protein J1N35_044071 [Gossypium stocksii]